MLCWLRSSPTLSPDKGCQLAEAPFLIAGQQCQGQDDNAAAERGGFLRYYYLEDRALISTSLEALLRFKREEIPRQFSSVG